MRKEIKKVGSRIGIIFNKEQQRIYDLKLDNVIEISITIVKKKEPE